MYLEGLNACQVIDVTPQSLLQFSATVLRPRHCTQHAKQLQSRFCAGYPLEQWHTFWATQHRGGVKSSLHLWPSLPEGWETGEHASFQCWRCTVRAAMWLEGHDSRSEGTTAASR